MAARTTKAKPTRTNALGPGTKNLTVNVARGFDAEIGALADASEISKSDYVRAILRFALQQKIRFRLEMENAGKVIAAATANPAILTLDRR